MRNILMLLSLTLALFWPVHDAMASEDTSLSPHVHTMGSWQGNGDGTHTRICNTYDCDYSETEDCTLFPANCVQSAFCTVCAQNIERCP